MKKYLIFLLAVSFLMACKNETKNNTVLDETINEEIAYASFGEKIVADDALTTELMAVQYKSMKIGDTINAKMSAKINEVCSTKGCWMKLDLGDDKEVMVKFKDYGFFMPLNAEGEVIINGKAFIDEMSVNDLRHYAEDAGKSKEEIEAITEPKLTYSFLADGVLLKE
ncbi:MAG: DUF4920 domain-containing protein [Flavobacteriaceae bacterium]|nr:DUF4920 domain-containing protein [Flavobacteriaceae bacterium]